MRLVFATVLILATGCRSGARAPSQTARLYDPAHDLGALFSAVQLAGIFPDSKTFADARPLLPPAALVAAFLEAQPADLVISGVQAADDPDGQLPSALAALLDLPHVSVVVSIEADADAVTVRQEFAGGVSHELEVHLPAVIGVQSARQTPRYAPIARIRQAMQAGGLTELAVTSPGPEEGVVLRRMHRPETTGRAEMLTGSPGEVADQIVELLRDRGLVKG